MLNSEKIKGTVKGLLDSSHTYRYHFISKNAAYQALHHVEKQHGKLGQRKKKLAIAYASDVLGWKGYAPWLFVYTAVHGDFKEGWIPDNFYGKVVVPKIQGEYGEVSFLKPLNNIIFGEEMSPNLASFVNGFWFDKHFNQLATDKVKETLFQERNKVVFKLDQSFQGKGVIILEEKDFEVSQVAKLGNGVIQPYIEQHPFFEDFLSKAVATIRLTTILDSTNNASLRACYLRLGRSNDTHVQSSNHVRIPIDMETGAPMDFGYLPNWKTIEEHPDSNIPFSQKAIPNYKACVEKVLRLHKKVPMVRSIGWDMVVDNTGEPVIMEWNGFGNDIKFSEATQGPCFADLEWENLAKKH